MNTEIGVDNGDSRNDTKITNSVDSNTTSRTGMISIVSDNYMDIFQQAEDMRNANQVVEALELYKKVLELTNNTHSESLFFTASILGEKDLTTEYNPAKSMEYMEAAVEAGNPRAMCSLAYIYFEMDSPESSQKAYELYEKAANLGDPEAFSQLGYIWHTGEGVEPNTTKAIQYYEQAAERGFADAQYNLGSLYLAGEVVDADQSLAREYFEQAAAKNHAGALLAIGLIYKEGVIGLPQDYKAATRYFRKATETNSEFLPQAQFEYGYCLLNGQGVEKDVDLALSYISMAAEEGANPDAQFCMACIYKDGEILEANETLCMEWLIKAAENGHLDAKASIDNLSNVIHRSQDESYVEEDFEPDHVVHEQAPVTTSYTASMQFDQVPSTEPVTSFYHSHDHQHSGSGPHSDFSFSQSFEKPTNSLPIPPTQHDVEEAGDTVQPVETVEPLRHVTQIPLPEEPLPKHPHRYERKASLLDANPFMMQAKSGAVFETPSWTKQNQQRKQDTKVVVDEQKKSKPIVIDSSKTEPVQAVIGKIAADEPKLRRLGSTALETVVQEPELVSEADVHAVPDIPEVSELDTQENENGNVTELPEQEQPIVKSQPIDEITLATSSSSHEPDDIQLSFLVSPVDASIMCEFDPKHSFNSTNIPGSEIPYENVEYLDIITVNESSQIDSVSHVELGELDSRTSALHATQSVDVVNVGNTMSEIVPEEIEVETNVENIEKVEFAKDDSVPDASVEQGVLLEIESQSQADPTEEVENVQDATTDLVSEPLVTQDSQESVAEVLVDEVPVDVVVETSDQPESLEQRKSEEDSPQKPQSEEISVKNETTDSVVTEEVEIEIVAENASEVSKENPVESVETTESTEPAELDEATKEKMNKKTSPGGCCVVM